MPNEAVLTNYFFFDLLLNFDYFYLLQSVTKKLKFVLHFLLLSPEWKNFYNLTCLTVELSKLSVTQLTSKVI